MNPMPSKTIGREAYLWTKGLYGSSNNFRPKRCPNILRKEELKETMDFMLDGGRERHAL